MFLQSFWVLQIYMVLKHLLYFEASFGTFGVLQIYMVLKHTPPIDIYTAFFLGTTNLHDS